MTNPSVTFGENTNRHPLEIVDAREAQHLASKTQREHSGKLMQAKFALADAEYTYNTAKVARIKQLKEEGWAVTTCAEVAKGEESIAQLRRERDRRVGELENLQDHSYTLGADRRALDGLIHWSEQIQLRTDAEPTDWSTQPIHGRGVPAGVDPATGEMRDAA